MRCEWCGVENTGKHPSIPFVYQMYIGGRFEVEYCWLCFDCAKKAQKHNAQFCN